MQASPSPSLHELSRFTTTEKLTLSVCMLRYCNTAKIRILFYFNKYHQYPKKAGIPYFLKRLRHKVQRAIKKTW